jgi:homoserine kinase type II
MSVFTTVTREQLAAWLQQYSVGTLAALEGIPAGIENTNYFVTTSRARYVLTLFEKLKAQELPYYLGLQDHLAAQGVPAPRPIPDRAGRFANALNGKPAALVVFLPGKDLAAPGTEHCAQAGEMLARIHVAGSSYRATMDNPRGPQWWTAVVPEIAPFLSGKDRALLDQEVRFQARHRARPLPRGPIHADLFRDNVLFERGRISGVIDFYFACNDALLYDVAIAVNDWCLAGDGALDRARTRALLDAYAGVRPFTEAERDAWPVMLRAGALRFWVSRLYDFYLPRPGELTHAKDPGHFGSLLARHAEAADRLPQLCPRAV